MSAERTLLQQYDREQQPGYRDGYEDGRLKGYEVGHRHAAERAGMPASADERYLRRLLAVRVAMPHTYMDDGEAQGQEHGISIDFMREPVADIDAKMRALNVARMECSAAPGA